MKIDLSKCKTPDDVERAMKPLGDLVARAKSLLAGESTGHLAAEDVQVKVDNITIEIGESAKPRRKKAKRP